MNKEERLKKALEKLDAVEPEGCPKCWKGSPKKAVKPEFKYGGSSLGTFPVKNARVLECPSCGRISYSRSESRRWEMSKALQVVLHNKLLSAKELRFIREALGKTRSNLADQLGVHKSTVSRWEQGIGRAQASKEMCRYFTLHVLSNYLWVSLGSNPDAEEEPRMLTFLRQVSENVGVNIDHPRVVFEALEEGV